MKPSPRQLAALLAVIHLAAASLAAQMVNLYASPESGAAQVGQVATGDERLMLSAPVQDSVQAEKGWMYVTLDEEYTGYANSGDLDQFGAGDGLPIYARPNDQSSLMTIAESGERVDVGNREGGWNSVTVKKPLTVYYNEKGNPASAAPATAAAPAAPAATSRPAAAPAQASQPTRPASPASPKLATSPRGRTLDASDPAIAAAMGQRTTVPADAVYDERAASAAPVTQPAVSSAPAEEDSGLAPATAPQPRRQAPAQPAKGTPSDLARSLEGTFGPAKGGWFSRPPYPYALFDSEGRRIAYVDVSEALLSRPVVELEERKVSAYGVLQKTDGNDLVVKARLLTPQQ